MLRVIIIILVQQLTFLATGGFRYLLFGIAWWVISIPNWILWFLYFIAPIAYIYPLSTKSYLALLAKTGWLYVAMACLWLAIYIMFSEICGVPVHYKCYAR